MECLQPFSIRIDSARPGRVRSDSRTTLTVSSKIEFIKCGGAYKDVPQARLMGMDLTRLCYYLRCVIVRSSSVC